MISRLIYTSQAASRMTYAQVREINEQAQNLNAQKELSGLLVYGSCRFLQVLEGHRDTVSATYHRIVRDARHCDLSLIDVSEVPARHFCNWTMRLIVVDQSHESVDSSTLASYGMLKNFNPAALRGPEIVELLKTLVK